MSVKLVPCFEQHPEQRVRGEYNPRTDRRDVSSEGFQSLLPVPVQGFQELETACVFDNPESTNFHGLGQPSCSGKHSTVKEQLLLVCSLMRGGESGLQHLLCMLFKDLQCKTVLEAEFRLFLKGIPFSWTEESDSSLLFCLLALFGFSSFPHWGGGGGGGRCHGGGLHKEPPGHWPEERRLWNLTCQSQPETQNFTHGLTAVIKVWLKVLLAQPLVLGT